MPESLFNEVAGLRPAALLKKRFCHRCFSVNFVKFLRAPFLQNTSGGCFWHFKVIAIDTLTHFWPMFEVYNPWNFFGVFRGCKMGHWPEMDLFAIKLF